MPAATDTPAGQKRPTATASRARGKSMAADISSPATTLLGRAYARILAWPCPTCGGVYPCRCDQADGETQSPTGERQN
jgi:hypothetical protein